MCSGYMDLIQPPLSYEAYDPKAESIFSQSDSMLYYFYNPDGIFELTQ